MTICKILYGVISPISETFTVCIPFQTEQKNVDTGCISFFETSRRNITTRTEAFTDNETLKTSVIQEVEVQIDFIKSINSQEPDKSAPEMANKVLIYLSSRGAMDEFFARGYELIKIGNISTSVEFLEDGRAYEKSFFRVKFYTESSYIGSDIILENIEITMQEVN